MSNPVYLLTDFSCCEDFETFLRKQNHTNRELLDSLTTQIVGEWNRKACNLAIMGSNICLLDKEGVTLATVPALLQDGKTITRDLVTGEIKCVRIVAQGANKPVNIWLGTNAEYNAIEKKSPADTVYFITDINLSDVYTKLVTEITWRMSVMAGNTVVPKAKNAANADNATSADRATYATNADYATSAGNATTAGFASSAGSAAAATRALNADKATEAGQLNNNGTIFARKTIWSGIKTIAAGGYADLFTTEDVNKKYLIVETDRFRTYPMMFDTTSGRVSDSKAFGNIGIHVDNTQAKRVRVENDSNYEITVSKIYVEL